MERLVCSTELTCGKVGHCEYSCYTGQARSAYLFTYLLRAWWLASMSANSFKDILASSLKDILASSLTQAAGKLCNFTSTSVHLLLLAEEYESICL